MSLTPLNLQVLFSKAVEYAQQIGRQSANEAFRALSTRKESSQRSVQSDTFVHSTEAYDEDHTGLSSNTPHTGVNQASPSQTHGYPSATETHLKEKGMGSIIDIID